MQNRLLFVPSHYGCISSGSMIKTYNTKPFGGNQDLYYYEMGSKVKICTCLDLKKMKSDKSDTICTMSIARRLGRDWNDR